MLKITTRNENINRRMAKKEKTYLFLKIIRCFFVYSSRSKQLNAFRAGRTAAINFLKSKRTSSRDRFFISQFCRYYLN